MPWHIIINDPCDSSQLTDAIAVMDNFAYRLQDVLPLNNVGTETDDAYNLGSALFRWRNGFFSQDLTVDGDIVNHFVDMWKYACFIKTAIPNTSPPTMLPAYEYQDDTYDLFPGKPYFTYDGAIHWRVVRTGSVFINQYIYLFFPVYSADITTANWTIPCTNDSTLGWQLIDTTNGLVSSGTKVWGGGNLVITGGGGGNILQGHYILCIRMGAPGSGLPMEINIGRWMDAENCTFSSYITSLFVNSTLRRTQANDVWNWAAFGDGWI